MEPDWHANPGLYDHCSEWLAIVKLCWCATHIPHVFLLQFVLSLPEGEVYYFADLPGIDGMARFFSEHGHRNVYEWWHGRSLARPGKRQRLHFFCPGRHLRHLDRVDQRDWRQWDFEIVCVDQRNQARQS